MTKLRSLNDNQLWDAYDAALLATDAALLSTDDGTLESIIAACDRVTLYERELLKRGLLADPEEGFLCL